MPMYKNSAYSVALTIQDENGEAVDLTNYDLGMKFYRMTPSHKTPLAITEGEGITVTSPATGIAQIDLTPTQVDSLGTGSIRVELYKNYSNDTTRTMLFEGTEVVEGHRTDA